MTQISLHTLLDLTFQDASLHSIILSHPSKKEKKGISKVTIRPLIIKNKKFFQASLQKGAQVFHENIEFEFIKEKIENWLMILREGHFYLSESTYLLWKRKDGTIIISQKGSEKKILKLQHNRTKNYLFQEGVPYPFFIALKVMDAKGRVLADKRDKFKQVNRFLEVFLDSLKEINLDKDKPIKIVDLGCGKAYLTFALYHYLSEILHLDVAMTGIDLKEEVITLLNQISRDCGYQKLIFKTGSIKEYPLERIDIVIALHACNIATDHALAKAVNAQAKMILAAPCCQHELLNQVDSSTLSPLLKHGILKERFAALLTDACRATLLDCVGYKTQILEFIDAGSTPKNLLIKAIKRAHDQDHLQNREQYAQLKKSFQISPTLEKLLHLNL